MSNHVSGIAGKDPLLPDVKLDIGGKVRQLVFDFNAICTVTSITGINLLEASVGVTDAPSMRALLFASLLHNDPDLTLEEVGSWITMKNIVHVKQALLTAWFLSIEVDKSDEDAGLGEVQAQA